MLNLKKLRYDTDIILGEFALTRSTESCVELDKILAPIPNFSVREPHLLEEARQALIREGDFWNEEELKMQFLALLMFLVKINEPGKLKVFYERQLAATVKGHDLSVVCDLLMATPFGINTPKSPYFFLQEFKKAKNAADAEGQMLVAMLIAQQLNGSDKPVYGCWLQGKNWIFTTLHDDKYCVSPQYDVTNYNDLLHVLMILTRLRTVIVSELIPQQSK